MAYLGYDELKGPDQTGAALVDLDAFAETRAATGEYAAPSVSSPLTLRGGTGAPPNATAIR